MLQGSVRDFFENRRSEGQREDKPKETAEQVEEVRSLLREQGQNDVDSQAGLGKIDENDAEAKLSRIESLPSFVPVICRVAGRHIGT